MQDRSNPVSRNYAEALLALATKADNREGFGVMIRDVASAIGQDPTIRLFLESPRVSYERKNEILARAFGDRIPRVFLRFLQTMVHNRRQMMIPEIATEYAALLDSEEGRVHAEVTVARPTTDAETASIGAELSRVLGKRVMPQVSVDPAIMGGVIVRVGNTVMDGSVRRRLSKLATRMRVTA
ncbi:MAG TPA: ATP synthase F1 subunit delta [Gemmatimonadaceae bacterium]|jgi:F-type H+-transporting ATPase subunit delta